MLKEIMNVVIYIQYKIKHLKEGRKERKKEKYDEASGLYFKLE